MICSCSNIGRKFSFVPVYADYLWNKAKKSATHGFTQGTAQNHRTMWRKYMKFCKSLHLQYVNPSVKTVCMYIQYLMDAFSSAKSVRAYVGAIELLHKYFNISAPNLKSFEVALMLRAATLTMRIIPVRRQPLELGLIKRMCTVCDSRGLLGQIIKLAILVAFLGFLRASNLCPSSQGAFDCTKHLTRQDVWIAPPGLNLKLKWSKTLQQAMQPRLIPLVRATDPALDVVTTFQRVVQSIPAQPNDSLFLLPSGAVLTTHKFRQTFDDILINSVLTQKSIVCTRLEDLARPLATQLEQIFWT